ncbi:hypothetical protein C6P08_05255 [Weissella confusa]|uniref:hypothetical protein n=1 Tax=Weissella confusa TaxID=1583 RepID=UPI0010930B13|nr:hypothetical protein [Weissella confusa]MBJ7695126.1 hypothetical protein [Weissella confusa]QBZ04617.1 hypothetical protein C6P08_05255 [Weissella confusa]
MEDILGVIILFADELFTLEGKKQFGYRFWLSIIAYIVSLIFIVGAVAIFIVLLNMLKTDIWWLIGLIEILIGVFIFLYTKRIWVWTTQLIAHFKD